MENIKSRKKGTPLGIRNWISFVLVGLIGQCAWAIENMFLNRYVFHCTGETTFIAPMVAASAIVATLTTLFIGALSDRLGKRKIFMSAGYIIWGIVIILFAVLDPSWFFVQNSVFLTGLFILILDCVMTFFGSSANDAAFNAYVTDVTDESNRGKATSVVSILPLISMIIIVGGFSGMTSGENPAWWLFFIIFGVITIVAGIVTIFVVPKDKIAPNKEQSYIRNLVHGFKPSVIKENKVLYATYIGFVVFNIAVQVFFPYFLIYIEHGLGIVGLDFTLCLGIVLVVACIITIVCGLFMDKFRKTILLFPAILITLVGGYLMVFAKDLTFVVIACIILITGYMLGTAIFSAKIKDLTPKKEAGAFEGIRMIFAVCIPMVVGPFIGEGLYSSTADVYINEFGVATKLPNETIFIGTAVVLVLAIAAVFWIKYLEDKIARKEAEKLLNRRILKRRK